MTLYVDPTASYNLGVNYNQVSAASGASTGSMRFIGNVGSLMARCLPLFICSLLGIPYNNRSK